MINAINNEILLDMTEFEGKYMKMYLFVKGDGEINIKYVFELPNPTLIGINLLGDE